MKFQSLIHQGFLCIGNEFYSSPGAREVSIPYSSGVSLYKKRFWAVERNYGGRFNPLFIRGFFVWQERKIKTVSLAAFQSLIHQGFLCINWIEDGNEFYSSRFNPLFIRGFFVSEEIGDHAIKYRKEFQSLIHQGFLCIQ